MRAKRRPTGQTVEDVRETLLRQMGLIKARYPGQPVLLRCGDFYLAFAEDAELVANVAGAPVEHWTRTLGGDRGFPPYTVAVVVASVPYHALHDYLAQLTRGGHPNVITVEQMPEEVRT